MKKETIGQLVKVVVFIICIVLIIMGQKKIGPMGLATMMVGLAGLLGLLYNYNKKFV